MAAIKRIHAELMQLGRDPIENCTAGPVDEDDLTHWQAVVTGPENSLYAGGNFWFNIQFVPEYPFKPPKVTIITKIYHVNIENSSGIVFLDLL